MTINHNDMDSNKDNNEMVFVPLLARYIPIVELLPPEKYKLLLTSLCGWFLTGEDNAPEDTECLVYYNLIKKDMADFRQYALEKIEHGRAVSRKRSESGRMGGAPKGNANAAKPRLNSEHANRLNDDKSQLRTIADNSGNNFARVRTLMRIFLRDCESNGLAFDDYYTFCWRLEQFCKGLIRIENGEIRDNN